MRTQAVKGQSMMCRRSRLCRCSRRALAWLPLLVTIASLGGPVPLASASTESADLATMVHAPTTRMTSGYLTYSITVTNNGPTYASAVSMSDSWFSGVTGFYGVKGSAPAGISCAVPAVGTVGTVTCATPYLAPGASMAVSLTIYVRILFHNQMLIDTATATSTTFDPNTANNTARWVVEGV